MPHPKHKRHRPAFNGLEKILSGFVEKLSEIAIYFSQVLQQRRDEFEWFQKHPEFVTKHDLEEMEKRIMSAISKFAAEQKTFNDRIDTAITGLGEDIKALNDKITELQNSPGAITPEDQALLDDLQARGDVIATKLEALDALTPPKPPA